MGNWKLLTPLYAKNHLANPQWFLDSTSDGWTISGDGSGYSLDRATNDCFKGIACAEANFGGGTTYVRALQSINLTTGIHTISAYVKRASGDAPTGSHFKLVSTGVLVTPTFTAVGNGWYRAVYSENTNSSNFGFYCYEDGIKVDALMLEANTAASSYVDGDQPGCRWLYGFHLGASERSATTRLGGEIQDLKADFGFGVTSVAGAEATTQKVQVDEYATIPGGAVANIQKEPREFILTGQFTRTSTITLAERIATLRKALDPEGTVGTQPVVLWYTGGQTYKEITAYYTAGLEGSYPLTTLNLETTVDASIQFLAEDPNWYRLQEACAKLTGQENPGAAATDNFPLIAYNRTTGWTIFDQVTGNAAVHSMAIGPDGFLYVVGAFMDWNGETDWNLIVKIDLETGTSYPVGPINSFQNGIIYDIAIHPNGTIYVGGSFTAAGGSPGDYVAKFNGTSWSALKTGGTGTVYTLALEYPFGTGDLWIGGSFTNWGGQANGDNIIYYDASADSWDVLTNAGTNGSVYKIVADLRNRQVYIVGAFTTIDGISANYIAKSEFSGSGSSTTSIVGNSATDINGNIRSIEIADDGQIFICGTFTSAAGNTNAKYFAKWDGNTWEELADTSDVSGTYTGFLLGPDNKVWFLQNQPSASVGDVTVIQNKTLHWLGARIWSDIPSIKNVWWNQDPHVPGSYSMAFGSWDSTISDVDFPTSHSITNEGSARTWMRLVVKETTGHTGVGAEVKALQNSTTGKFWTGDHAPLDEDWLIFDTDPTKAAVSSDLIGTVHDQPLIGCDRYQLYLVPGINLITFRMNDKDDGTAHLTWRVAYNGMSD